MIYGALLPGPNNMGCICIKTLKKVAQVLSEKYYSFLGNSFHTNKPVCGSTTIIPSKKLHNKVAGYVTVWWSRFREAWWEISASSCRRRREKGEIIMFLRSQSWIWRSFLSLRNCWSSWSLAVCPICRSVGLQLGWISKHHMELFESFCCAAISSVNLGKEKVIWRFLWLRLMRLFLWGVDWRCLYVSVWLINNRNNLYICLLKGGTNILTIAKVFFPSYCLFLSCSELVFITMWSYPVLAG